MMTHAHDRLVGIVTQTVLDGAPVFAVAWDEPEDAHDSGFLCWSLLDEPPDSQTPDDQLAMVCLQCLIDAHPEAGALMDQARRDADGLAFALDDDA